MSAVRTGLLGCLLLLGCDGGDQPPPAPAEQQEKPEPSAPQAPKLVHDFGDGETCKRIGGCRLADTWPLKDGNLNWSLKSARQDGAYSIELVTSADGAKLQGAGVTFDESAPDEGFFRAFLVDMGAADEVESLVQHANLNIYTSQQGITEAPAKCGKALCVRAAKVGNEEVLSVDFDVPAEAEAPAPRKATAVPKGSKKSGAPEKTAATPQKSKTCCKHCKSGKPCGDSCISASKTCHKGPGCAC